MSDSRALALAAAAVCLTAAAATPLAAGEVSWNGSLSASRGDYTLSEETTTVMLLAGVSWREGRWRLAASLPLIHQDTPFVAYSGGVPIPVGRRHGDSGNGTGGDGHAMGHGMGSGRGGEVVVPDPGTLEFDETGIGDPLLRADVSLTDPGARTRFGLWAGFKPGLADEDGGFGTGESDVGGGVTVGGSAGVGNVAAELGYWSLGDPPDFEIEDPIAWSLYYGRPLGDRGSLLTGVAGWSESAAGADGPVWATVSLGRRMAPGRGVNVSLSSGLTDTAADWLLSFGWTITPSST